MRLSQSQCNQLLKKNVFRKRVARQIQVKITTLASIQHCLIVHTSVFVWLLSSSTFYSVKVPDDYINEYANQ